MQTTTSTAPGRAWPLVAAVLASGLITLQCTRVSEAADPHDRGLGELPTEQGFRHVTSAHHRQGRETTTTWRIRDWAEGPHSGFEEADVATLAARSLAWLATSRAWAVEDPSSEDLAGSPGFLELVYETPHGVVAARFAPDLEQSWEAQLSAWFEDFPPGGPSPAQWGALNFVWRIRLEQRGYVFGVHSTRDAAVAGLRSAHERLASMEGREQDLFSLGVVSRDEGGGITQSSEASEVELAVRLFDQQPTVIPPTPRPPAEQR